MQQRHADLGVVDEVVRIFLPDAEAEIARAEREVAPELELRVALGLEVELGERRL